MTEWICETCVHYPPSSMDGKPCSMCNPNEPFLNCYQKREETLPDFLTGMSDHPVSNADRIRAMSDEGLAEFIGGIYTLERDAWGDYDPCVVVEQSVKIRDKEDMLDWLRSPVGDDENGS